MGRGAGWAGGPLCPAGAAALASRLGTSEWWAAAPRPMELTPAPTSPPLGTIWTTLVACQFSPMALGACRLPVVADDRGGIPGKRVPWTATSAGPATAADSRIPVTASGRDRAARASRPDPWRRSGGRRKSGTGRARSGPSRAKRSPSRRASQAASAASKVGDIGSITQVRTPHPGPLPSACLLRKSQPRRLPGWPSSASRLEVPWASRGESRSGRWAGAGSGWVLGKCGHGSSRATGSDPIPARTGAAQHFSAGATVGRN